MKTVKLNRHVAAESVFLSFFFFFFSFFSFFFSFFFFFFFFVLVSHLPMSRKLLGDFAALLGGQQLSLIHI